jgi:hypothetical protein
LRTPNRKLSRKPSTTTLTEGTALTPPSAFPVDQDPSHPMYGFKIDKWVSQPIRPKGPDWFHVTERYRRNANENMYQQIGNQTKWNRYINHGLFVFEDCRDCDKMWAATEPDTLMIHRSICYNFMCHVDRELQIPDKLNAWATNVSQEPYLAHYDPTTLHETDTINYTWKDMPFMTETKVKQSNDWISVQGRRQSNSPTNQNNQMKTQSEETVNYRPLTSAITGKGNLVTNRSMIKKLFKTSWKKSPSVTTVSEENTINRKLRKNDIGTTMEGIASNDSPKMEEKSHKLLTTPHPHSYKRWHSQDYNQMDKSS